MADLGTPIQIHPNDVQLVVVQRARPGSIAGPSGAVNPEDMEIAVALCVGVTRPGGLLTPDGKAQGVMVPVAQWARPLLEFADHARMMLGGGELAAQAKKDGET